jgi:hypothetical protein
VWLLGYEGPARINISAVELEVIAVQVELKGSI